MLFAERAVFGEKFRRIIASFGKVASFGKMRNATIAQMERDLKGVQSFLLMGHHSDESLIPGVSRFGAGFQCQVQGSAFFLRRYACADPPPETRAWP